jgi:hypothetical protein
MDLIARIKTLAWKRTKSYRIMGGYNDEFTADNGDKIVLSTCNSETTKYVINGKSKSIGGKEEDYIYNKFW